MQRLTLNDVGFSAHSRSLFPFPLKILIIVARSQGGPGVNTTVFMYRGGASGLSPAATYNMDPMSLNELGLSTANVVVTVSGAFLHVTANDTGAPAGSIIKWTATVQTTEESY